MTRQDVEFQSLGRPRKATSKYITRVLARESDGLSMVRANTHPTNTHLPNIMCCVQDGRERLVHYSFPVLLCTATQLLKVLLPLRDLLHLPQWSELCIVLRLFEPSHEQICGVDVGALHLLPMLVEEGLQPLRAARLHWSSAMKVRVRSNEEQCARKQPKEAGDRA